MRVIKQSKTNKFTIAKKVRWSFGGLIVLGLMTLFIATISTQQPAEVNASTDPGLDSGNATVDRTSVPGQTILKYTTAGNSIFKAPAGVTDVRVLVVGGGGGGGAGESLSGGDGGGGGGAGEFLAQPTTAVTPGTAMTVTVGNGGSGSTTKQPDGGTTAQDGANGGNSVFGSLTARGGGGGGGNDQSGRSGGSGGGAGGQCTNSGRTGGSSTAVAPGVGNSGGSGSGSCSNRGGSGGGGAGANGTASSGTSGAAGGAGLQNDITGVNAFYAAGANGGTVSTNATGAAGAANTGSGGGGGGSGTSTSAGFGGNGGTGVVIVRFATQNFPDPGGVSGTTAWYKADSAGNTNAQWNDVSGFNNTLTQGTAGNQPALTINSLNFNPAYVFDGTDDVFNMPNNSIGASDSMSMFYAANSTTTAGGDRYFNEFGDDRPSITIYNGKPRLYVRDTSSVDDQFSTIEALQPRVYSFVSPNGGGTKVIGVDNREETKSVTGNYTTGGGNANNKFGGKNVSSGTSWQGPIGEAIFFNRSLSAVERQKVNSYLAIKWGVTLGTGSIATDYYDSSAATIWTADNTYKNNIAGIGRDDTSTLNQKQSMSTADGSLVTIGHGDIAASNQANANNFANDKTFMLWGHDAGVTDQATAVSGTSLMRMARVWKVVVTNTVGATKVQIPSSIITRNSATLLTSSSATFDGSSQQVPMSINGANYEATTTLAPGTHYFTFASEAGSDIEFVSKTATDTSNNAITNYTPGQPLEYHLVVRNNGPDDAGTVTVSDTLPAGIVPVPGGASGDGWGPCPVSGQTVTCTRSSLAAGATAPEIIIEATIASSVTGQKTNTADASVANDPVPGNNNASVTLDAAPEADLSITKAHTGTPTAGNPLTYDFTVSNDGPSDVSSFTVTDNFDPNLTFSSATAQVTCTGTTNVSCTSVAPLTAGDSRSFSITVDVSGSFGGGSITNTASVAPPAGTTDPNSANNTADDDTSINVSTDLTISKTHTGNFTAGTNNTFTINVTNNGPSDAPLDSVSITDTLDEDFSYVSAAGTNWNCNPAPATTVSCTYNVALTSGSTTEDITVTVAVDPIVKGTTANTATVSGTTPDPNQGNNSSTDNITIEADADMAITKTHVDTQFTAGQTGEYTLSVTNNGPSADTPTYKITDVLPTGLTYAGTAPNSDTTCTSADNITVECTGGGLGAGDPAQVTTIIVNVDPSATTPITNTASVAPDPSVTDSNMANNTDDDTVNIEPNADLALIKTPPVTMTAGDTADYTVTVTNNGPSDIASFTITDTLDANLTYQSSSPSICSVVNQDVTCNGGAITSGNNTAVTITVAVAPTATPGATINNTATVEAPTGVNDPDLTNNTDTVNNTIVTSADLAITKTHTGNFTVGSNGDFTITATNNGPSDASTATITDVLPEGFTYVSDAVTPAGAADCSNSGQTVTCLMGPTFGSGESVDITLTVAVDPTTTATSIDNTASISAVTPDPDMNNNSSTDTVIIDPATANLTATKTAQGTLTAGNSVTYRFEVTNDGGPDNAGIITITDTLPSYLTYQSFNSVSGGTWNCNPSAPGVVCTLPVLDVGDTGVVDVTVLVAEDAPSPAENNATVTFNGTDPSPVDLNTSDPVSYEADLEVQLTHDSESYESGETVTFTYTVINHGPSRAEDVVLTDTLPDGLTFESIVATHQPKDDSLLAKVVDTVLGSSTASAAPNTPFTCSNSGQDVNCNASALSVGTYTITMTAQISDSFTGSLTSMAQITSATFDPNTANNSSIDTIADVQPRPGGLAGTGQNILTWVILAVGALAAAAVAFTIKRKFVQSSH